MQLYVNLTGIIALNSTLLNAWKAEFQPYETKELKSSPH